MLSVAVPIVLLLTFAVKTTLQEPDLSPQTASYLPWDPLTVAMCFDSHVLALKVKTLPFGPVALTEAVGLTADKLSEHGVRKTP